LVGNPLRSRHREAVTEKAPLRRLLGCIGSPCEESQDSDTTMPADKAKDSSDPVLEHRV
jgi:hypothetical protein